MRPSERIASLIFWYLRDELSREQARELTEWRNASPENEQFFQEEIDPENIRKEISDMYANKDKVWEKIMEKDPGFSLKQKKPRRLFWVLTVAAIIIVSLGFSLYVLFRSPSKHQDQVNVASTNNKAIVPGGNHGVLVLADRSVIKLDSVGNGVVSTQGAITVTKKDSGQLVYSSNGQVSAGETGFNTLKTPRGGQYQVVLPDGTKVWINAASSLKYPAFFAANERKVELNGEAYFEVAKNPKSPFRVTVNGKPGVEVLGTHFNIMAYSDEPFMAATLLEGSVKVGSTILKPGQQAKVEFTEQKIQVVNDIDINEIIAWKNGKTSFKDASIQTIMRAVSRWYDVDISYEGKIPDKRFKGGLPRDANLSDLLSVLEQSGIHFRVEGKKITVTP
jgi:ferric-dicitrate binding protein FerR (iron transport regulator)